MTPREVFDFPLSVRSVLRTVLACAVALVSAFGSATVASAEPPPPVPPPAADPFYSFDGPLDGVAPGTILRSRPVPFGFQGVTFPVVATQVLYRTTDQHGAPTTTVATVLRPLTPGPPRLISYHMAYDALGSECDPSYTLTGNGAFNGAGALEQSAVAGYLADGYSVVVPNYEGPQLDWVVGRQSGYAALDGVRAAETVLDLPASTPVGLAGYSGGSVPTQWGAEIAPEYAPEVNIVGAAAGGPPVHLAHNLPYISGSTRWAGVIPALVVAYGRAYDFDPDAFLSDYGREVVAAVDSQCIGGFASHYPGLTDADMVRAPYRSLLDVPDVVMAINDNIMGTSGTPRAPMFLAVGDADGTGDGVMVTADVEGLAREYCDRGVPITYARYDGLSHAGAFVPFQAQAAQFLTDRFAGAPAGNNCADFGSGNSLAPVPVP